MSAHTIENLLPDDALLRFRDRAPHYDDANVFFGEDFAELRGAAINSIQAAELIRTFGIKVEF